MAAIETGPSAPSLQVIIDKHFSHRKYSHRTQNTMGDFARNLTSLLDSARELTLDAIASPNFSHLNINYNALVTGAVPEKLSSDEVVKMLNSGNERDISLALKYIVKLMTTDPNAKVLSSETEAVQYFAEVIKNVTSTNNTIKRLVYAYLSRYNHLQPDTALLSINAIQRTLLDKNPVIRSLAIRVISGVKIPAILPILVLSIKKTANDLSPLVRSSTAVAISKCVLLDRQYHLESADSDPESNTNQLKLILSGLLLDNDPQVLGSAIVAFSQCFPTDLALVHKCYRHICSHIVNLDEFSQPSALEVLTNYVRMSIPHGSVDIDQLLNGISLLVFSQSSAVLLAVCRTVLAIGSVDQLITMKMHLVLLRIASQGTNIDIACQAEVHTSLELLFDLASRTPSLLENHLSRFFLTPSDDTQTCFLKLQLLAVLTNDANFAQVFKELKYLIGPESGLCLEVKRKCIQTVNTLCVSQKVSFESVNKMLWWFVSRVESQGNDSLAAEYLTGIRYIIQKDVLAYVSVLAKLVGQLFGDQAVKQPNARASIIWLVGEYSNASTLKENSSGDFVPDAIRLLVKDFPQEKPMVKLQVLTLIAKVFVNDIFLWQKSNSEPFGFSSDIFKMFNLVLQYCKYDAHLDVRDRARTMCGILPNLIGIGAAVNANSLASFKEYLEDEKVVKSLEEKLQSIDVAVLMLQVFKESPVQSHRAASESDAFLSTYLSKSVPDWNADLDDGLSSRFERLREVNLVKDFSRNVSAISSKTAVIPQSSNYNGNGSSGKVGAVSVAKKYQLQSLDEFFADEDEDDEEEEEGSFSDDSSEQEESEESDESDESD